MSIFPPADSPPYEFRIRFSSFVWNLIVMALFAAFTSLISFRHFSTGRHFSFDDFDGFAYALTVISPPLWIAAFVYMLRISLSSRLILSVDESGWTAGIHKPSHLDWSEIESIRITVSPGLPITKKRYLMGVVPSNSAASLAKLGDKERRVAQSQLKLYGMMAIIPDAFLPMRVEKVAERIDAFAQRMIRESKPKPPVISQG